MRIEQRGHKMGTRKRKGLFNYLFAQKARRGPEYVASLVFCSTLLSLLYLPLLLAWLM